MNSLTLKTFLVANVVFINLALAQTYVCTNVAENVKVTASLNDLNIATIQVESPFSKQMTCDVNEMTNADTNQKVTALICDNGDGLPDLMAIQEDSTNAMIEVVGQPHFDLSCEVR